MVLQNILLLISEKVLFTSDFIRQKSFTIEDLTYSSLHIYVSISIYLSIYIKFYSSIFIVDLACFWKWTLQCGDSCHFAFAPQDLNKIHILFKFENICTRIIVQSGSFDFSQEIFVYLEFLTEVSFLFPCVITEDFFFP